MSTLGQVRSPNVHVKVTSAALLTWETPCCRAQLAGSWSYWTTGPGTRGCVAWQCRGGYVTASCHWGAKRWGVWATTGLSLDSALYLRHKAKAENDFLDHFLNATLFNWNIPNLTCMQWDLSHHGRCLHHLLPQKRQPHMVISILYPCIDSHSPLISSSAQWDFLPLAASSLVIIVYIRRGSGGSYFSLGIPGPLQKQQKKTLLYTTTQTRREITHRVTHPVLHYFSTTAQPESRIPYLNVWRFSLSSLYLIIHCVILVEFRVKMSDDAWIFVLKLPFNSLRTESMALALDWTWALLRGQ